ncbi:Ger(x)C family spore germination C-terminal domain-containing protein [Bacillus cereus]
MELDGIALFKRCKMVDKVNPKDLFVFKLLTDNFKQGTYQFKLPGSSNTYATIENIKARTKYKMEGNSKHPFVNAHIQVKAEIQEFTKTKNLDNPKEIKKIRKNYGKRNRKKSNYIDKEIY